MKKFINILKILFLVILWILPFGTVILGLFLLRFRNYFDSFKK